MQSKEIILQAIKQAEENGWENPISAGHWEFDDDGSFFYSLSRLVSNHDSVHINEIIFDPEWAKAFWGIDWPGDQGAIPDLFYWEYHEQQLVILPKKDRPGYIKQFLKK